MIILMSIMLALPIVMATMMLMQNRNPLMTRMFTALTVVGPIKNAYRAFDAELVYGAGILGNGKLANKNIMIIILP